MAIRRMFSMEVVNTDSFLDLPQGAQCLYFHMGMRADDDGFLASPRRVTAMAGCTPEDLQTLVDQGFVIRFASGVCLLTHWKVNNYLQKDRYKPTGCLAERRQVMVDEGGIYRLDTACIQPVSNPDTQVREGKRREDKRREEDRTVPAEAGTPSGRTARSRYGWIRLSDEEYRALITDLGPEEAQRCITYVDESAQATGNRNKWRDWNLVLRRCHRDRWGMSKQPCAAKGVTAAAGYDDEDSFV